MKCVMNIFDLEKLSFSPWKAGENYGGAEVDMSKTWGAEKLGFHLERLDPGKFGCPYHNHQKEEELFIAIKGSATVRQEGEFFEVKTGDVFFYKLGVTHQMYNHTNEPFYFFALSNQDKEEVCEYPDSEKKMEAKTRTITQRGEVVTDYWKDEENPARFWPASILQK